MNRNACESRSGSTQRASDDCAFCSGDWSQHTAWREFDHNYAPLIRNVARKAGLTDAEADEVAQETLIAVAKRIGEFQHAVRRGSFRSWLYQQARWRIADQFRVRARLKAPLASSQPTTTERKEDSDPHPELFKSSGHPSAESDDAFPRLWEKEWEEHLLRTAVERVKRIAGPRQFQLFDLHVLLGLSVRAAAQAAGSTVAAVFMAKSRVGRMLRREVSRLEAAGA